MNILVRQATVIDPSSPFHLQKADIFIAGGKVRSMGVFINETADKVIDFPHTYITPGWLDIFSHFNDPGYEFKETLESGARAAAAGGYTDVMILPNTNPCLHNKSAVEYGVHRGSQLPVHIHPIGAITKNTEGTTLSEMYDMHASGARAFSDGINTIQSGGIMLKALQYLKAINKTIIQLPEDKALSNHGLMHEGVVSTRLGLPGKPALAEELLIIRDIELTKYTGSKLHITGISSAKSVELIREAKKEGIAITCSVTPYHLYFSDDDLQDYDTNLKVNPPIRSAADRKALQDGILDGTIDCIASHHLPEDADHKIIEFEYARPGMISLQTAFSVVMTAIPHLPVTRIVELFSTNPRKIFELPLPAVAEGAVAQFSLFSLPAEWTFDKEQNQSRSANTPFFNKKFAARPLGIINKGSLFLNLE